MSSRLFCGRISPSMRTTDFRLLGCYISEIHPGFTVHRKKPALRGDGLYDAGSRERQPREVKRVTLAIVLAILDSHA